MAELRADWSPLQRRVLAAMGMPPLRARSSPATVPSPGAPASTPTGGVLALACAGEVVACRYAAGFDASSKLGRAVLRAAGLGIAQPAASSQPATLEGPELAHPARDAVARRALWRQLRGLRRRLGADARP